MKNRIWVLTPYFLMFSIVMLVMSALTFQYNTTLFIIEISASVLSMIIVFVKSKNFKNYIDKIVLSAVKTTKEADEQYLENFRFPIAVVGENDEIITYNKYFKRVFEKGKEIIGESIVGYLGGIPLDRVVISDGTNIQHGSRKFTVFAANVGKSSFIYYIDDTVYKKIADKYEETRPNVAVIVLDNREDFMSENEEASGRAVLEVENTLQNWASENNSLFKKISGNRYIIIFEEKIVDELIKSKFEILDKVREINFKGRVATVSIGIGRGAENVKDSEYLARKALDMSLGRGGDQVAIIENGDYRFFGGVERAVEKRSKVKTRIISEAIQSAIESSDKVLVMGHSFSDFDCVGSSIGIYSLASKSFKKKANIVVDYNTSMAKPLIDKYINEKGENPFILGEDALNIITSKTLLIIVDTHSPNFLESKDVYEKCENVIVIDHHRKMVNHIDNTIIFYHEPSASSTSEMCTEIISYIGDETLSRVEAEALLSGIMLDTKNFVVKTGVRTFEAATYLRLKGADTITVKNLFSDNMETYREKYKIAANSEIYKGYAIAVHEEIIDNIRIIAAQAADDLLSIKGVEASFVIFPMEDGRINVSARSYGAVNVQVIMEELGGGGHQTMAAVQIKDTTVWQAKDDLINAIEIRIDEEKVTE